MRPTGCSSISCPGRSGWAECVGDGGATVSFWALWLHPQENPCPLVFADARFCSVHQSLQIGAMSDDDIEGADDGKAEDRWRRSAEIEDERCHSRCADRCQRDNLRGG